MANILISMSADSPNGEGGINSNRSKKSKSEIIDGSDMTRSVKHLTPTESDSGSLNSEPSSDVPITVQQIRRRISATTQQEERMNGESGYMQPQDIQVSSSVDPEDVERLRRERNKLHARKTRVRKKKLVHEMERIVSTLEEEVETLRSRSRSNTMMDEQHHQQHYGMSDMSTGDISAGEMGANVLASSFNRAAIKREGGDASADHGSGSGEGSNNGSGSNNSNRTGATGTTGEVDDSSDSKSTGSSTGSKGPAEDLLAIKKEGYKSNRERTNTGAVVGEQGTEERELLAQMSSVPKRRRVANLVKTGKYNAITSTSNIATSEGGTESLTNSGSGENRGSDSRSGGESSAGQAGDEATGSGGSGSDDKDNGSDPDEDRSSSQYTGRATDQPTSERKRRESGNKRRSGGASKPFTQYSSSQPLSAKNLEQHRHRLAERES